MKLYTYKTAAEVLDCSWSTVQKLCLAGKIPIVKIGNETRIREQDLEAWINRRCHYHKPGKCSDANRKQALPTEETTFARSK